MDDNEDRQSSSEEDTQSDDDASRERRPFDVTIPPTHQYLHNASANANEVSGSFRYEDPGSVITVTILEMPIVLLPTQLLPFHTDYPSLVAQLRQAARNNDYIALKPKIASNSSDIATLIQVRSMHENAGGISVQAVGRQRCRILSRRTAINGMPYGEVRVLDEKELPPFSHLFTPVSLSRLKFNKNIRYYSAMTAHSALALDISMTNFYISKLEKWLLGWYVYDKVRLVLKQGPTAFSYWVAANLPIDMESRLRLLDEPCTDRRLIQEYDIVNHIDIIICKSCGTTLSKMSDVICVSAEGSSAHYVNPNGYVHDLFTVSETTSTVAQGRPSSEFSWFPGYKWTIHNCRCGNHVGWRFTSSSLNPPSFFGLTRTSIRPADSRHPITSNVQRIEQLAIV